jgi:hypothetical protein
MSPQLRRIVLASLVAVHLIVDALIAFVMPSNRSDDFTIGLIFGTLFAQISLSSVWAAMGPERLVWRLPVTAFLGTLSCFAFLWGLLGDDVAEALPITVGICGMMLVQSLLIQSPLWLARLILGWRIGIRSQASHVPAANETQFGIRQLFVWTTIAAILLAIGRLMFRDQSLDGTAELWHICLIFGLLAAFNLLYVLPLAWAALVQNRIWLWLPLSVVCVGIVTTVEPTVFTMVTREPDPENIFVWINGIQVAWILASLLVVRLCGYRLVRHTAATLVEARLTDEH